MEALLNRDLVNTIGLSHEEKLERKERMRGPKITNKWDLLRDLLSILAPILWFGGRSFMVGSLIAISITSSVCVIMIIKGRAWKEWTTMVKVLGVEGLILVIGVVMWFASGGPWKPY